MAEQISFVEASRSHWSDRGRPTTSDRQSTSQGDAWPGNGRFSESGVTLFDFEHVSIEDPVSDLANVAWWLTGFQQPSHVKAELWDAFLTGYRDGCNTIPPDLSGLPYHVLSVERRSLLFLRDHIRVSQEVEEAIRVGTQYLVNAWQDRYVPGSGLLKDGW